MEPGVETPNDVRVAAEPWELLKEIIDSSNRVRLSDFFETLSSSDTARAISRLDEDTQRRLFSLLNPEDAADIIEELPEAQAKELIEDMAGEHAAAIVDEMPSDQQADILGSLDHSDAEAILQEMDPDEAKDARALLAYPPDVAGGLMVTEYLSYPDTFTINEIIDDLRKNAEKYSTYDVFYAYVVTPEKKLCGVVKVRDLILNPGWTRVEQIMIREPIFVVVEASLKEMENIFDRHDFFGIPTCDRQQRLVGVVRRSSLREAIAQENEKTFLQASGILGGEELRSLPSSTRTVRRFTILLIKIGLNLISASVIAAFYDTLKGAVALAVFLPVISDLGGSSGNQAVAVSIRELSLGLIKPKDYLNVMFQELRMGLILGASLGILLGVAAGLWHNGYLGLVVGSGLFLNTLLSVVVGGGIPLLLNRLRVDPAIASSAILTTITDGFGFFFVLMLASMLVSKLG